MFPRYHFSPTTPALSADHAALFRLVATISENGSNKHFEFWRKPPKVDPWPHSQTITNSSSKLRGEHRAIL
jgi:hypothetical protein